jgi:hypothetical protein
VILLVLNLTSNRIALPIAQVGGRVNVRLRIRLMDSLLVQGKPHQKSESRALFRAHRLTAISLSARSFGHRCRFL